jgi:transcriptional regulator with XRE-family HTH domain
MTKMMVLRVRCGLSQQQLARLSGVSQLDIGRAERGIAPLYPRQRKRIARVLGCDERDLLDLRGGRVSYRQITIDFGRAVADKLVTKWGGWRIPEPPTAGR